MIRFIQHNNGLNKIEVYPSHLNIGSPGWQNSSLCIVLPSWMCFYFVFRDGCSSSTQYVQELDSGEELKQEGYIYVFKSTDWKLDRPLPLLWCLFLWEHQSHYESPTIIILTGQRSHLQILSYWEFGLQSMNFVGETNIWSASMRVSYNYIIMGD